MAQSNEETIASVDFYFSTATGFGWKAPVFLLQPGRCGGQSRFGIGTSHDENSVGINYQSPSEDAAKGFDVATSMVINYVADSNSESIHFKMSKYGDDWYQVVLTEVRASQFWGNNVNYAKNGNYATVTTYLPASSFEGVSDEGKAYLHVSANPGSNSSSATASITNFVDGGQSSGGEEEPTPTPSEDDVAEAAKWVYGGAGDVSQLKSTAIVGGTQISGLHARTAELSRNEKLTLNGLEFDYEGQYLASTASAFYFSDKTSASITAPVFVSLFTHYNQFRVGITSNTELSDAAATSSPANYCEKDTSSTQGFSSATAMICDTKDTNVYHYAFQHVSRSWWKITITETVSGAIWGVDKSANAMNYSKDEATGLGSVCTYVPNSSFTFADEEDGVYMHIVSMWGAPGWANITNIKNGTYAELPEETASAEQIASAKAKLDAYDVNTYREGFAETFNEIKATAVAAMEKEKVTVGELDVAFNTFVSTLTSSYKNYLGYDTEITENDPNANWVSKGWPTHPESPAVRASEDGEVIVRVNGTNAGFYPHFMRTYDILNYVADINLLDAGDGSATMFNFSSKGQSYADDSNYHIEFLKTSATRYLVIFGICLILSIFMF